MAMMGRPLSNERVSEFLGASASSSFPAMNRSHTSLPVRSGRVRRPRCAQVDRRVRWQGRWRSQQADAFLPGPARADEHLLQRNAERAGAGEFRHRVLEPWGIYRFVDIDRILRRYCRCRISPFAPQGFRSASSTPDAVIARRVRRCPRFSPHLASYSGWRRRRPCAR